MTKREFLAASVGAGLALGKAGSALAQQAVAAAPRAAAKIPSRTAKTTKLFKSPPGFPNGIAVTPEGLWIAEQKMSGGAAVTYHLPEPKDLPEAAWLVDWNGKLLKTVTTQSRNTSGMAVGGGYVWMVANAAPGGRVPGGHELQAGQPPPDSAGPGGQRRRLPWRCCGRTANCGSHRCGCAAFCASTPRPGSRNL